ncbi:MAG: hypothetical protein HYU67_01855 [Flavobacteriia bacterium]|nr:hypothetical protein [Flavobacteriia bacterium]
MKKILTFIFICQLGWFYSQPPQFDDLLILFADGNYPKLIRESIKYSEKDATKGDPLVYLYLAKGYYKISFVADRDEEYKNAFKDCLGAIGKCIGKDKDGKIREEHHEFISQLKQTLLETIINDIDAKDYRKASGWANKVYKVSPNDIGAKYLEGACKYQSGDKGGANAFWKEADKLFTGIKDFSTMTPEDKELLKLGIYETAQCYMAMRQAEKAKTLVNKFSKHFEGDASFKEKFESFM